MMYNNYSLPLKEIIAQLGEEANEPKTTQE